MNYIFAPVTLLLAVGACSAKPYDDEPISLAFAGAKLNAAQVADLEATLVNRPDDLAAHTKLLGYKLRPILLRNVVL